MAQWVADFLVYLMSTTANKEEDQNDNRKS
jgi:hypothetical protein